MVIFLTSGIISILYILISTSYCFTFSDITVLTSDMFVFCGMFFVFLFVSCISALFCIKCNTKKDREKEIRKYFYLSKLAQTNEMSPDNLSVINKYNFHLDKMHKMRKSLFFNIFCYQWYEEFCLISLSNINVIKHAEKPSSYVNIPIEKL